MHSMGKNKRKKEDGQAGVSFCEKTQKWRAKSLDNLNLFLGFHDTEKLACKQVVEYAKFYGTDDKKGKKCI